MALIVGSELAPLPSSPVDALLTRTVVPVERSVTKTSETPFVSPATRSVAAERNATKRPSGVTSGLSLAPSPAGPPGVALTRSAPGIAACALTGHDRATRPVPTMHADTTD